MIAVKSVLSAKGFDPHFYSIARMDGWRMDGRVDGRTMGRTTGRSEKSADGLTDHLIKMMF